MNSTGSTSKDELNRRRTVGVNILVQYNFAIGRMQFRKLYRDTLKKKNIKVPKDSRLITRDIDKMQEMISSDYGKEVIWLDHSVKKPKNNSQFSELGHTLSTSIRYVYLIINNKEYVLYERKKIKKHISLNDFKKPIIDYIQKNEQYKIDSKNTKKKTTTISEELSNQNNEADTATTDDYNLNMLAKFLFIYDDDGLTNKVADYYNEEGSTRILYTTAHKYCTEVVTNMKYFNTVIEYVYYTVHP